MPRRRCVQNRLTSIFSLVEFSAQSLSSAARAPPAGPSSPCVSVRLGKQRANWVSVNCLDGWSDVVGKDQSRVGLNNLLGLLFGFLPWQLGRGRDRAYVALPRLGCGQYLQRLGVEAGDYRKNIE